MQNTAVRLALGMLATLSAILAQNVISAKAGLIHYTEGDVFLNDKAVDLKPSVYDLSVKANEVLRTEEGRAEVLLNPGMFFRLSENSSFRMVTNKLTDVRLEALTGTVMLETAELFNDYAVNLDYKNQSIVFKKAGLVCLNADTGVLKVYKGEAVVTRGTETFTVKEGHEADLGAEVLSASKFDNKVGDEFYRWASRRESYLSMANIASAKQMYDSGHTYFGGSSSWFFNPYYGMFTYIPYGGYYNSPFGYGFYNPNQVVGVVYPGYGGYRGGNGTGGWGPGGGGSTGPASIGGRPGSSSASFGGGAPSAGIATGGSAGGGAASGGGAPAGGHGGSAGAGVGGRAH